MTTKVRKPKPNFGSFSESFNDHQFWIEIKWKPPHKNGAPTKAEICLSVPMGGGWRRWRMSATGARAMARVFVQFADLADRENRLGH